MTTDYDKFKNIIDTEVNSVISKYTGQLKSVCEAPSLSLTNSLIIEIIKVLLKLGELVDNWANVANPEEVIAQQKLVPTAGTAVQLPPVEIPFNHEVTIMALTANTGTIYIGNSKLEAEDTTKSVPILAGQSLEYKIKNLSQLWVNATVANDGVMWFAEQRRHPNG